MYPRTPRYTLECLPCPRPSRSLPECLLWPRQVLPAPLPVTLYHFYQRLVRSALNLLPCRHLLIVRLGPTLNNTSGPSRLMVYHSFGVGTSGTVFGYVVPSSLYRSGTNHVLLTIPVPVPVQEHYFWFSVTPENIIEELLSLSLYARKLRFFRILSSSQVNHRKRDEGNTENEIREPQ